MQATSVEARALTYDPKSSELAAKRAISNDVVHFLRGYKNIASLPNLMLKDAKSEERRLKAHGCNVFVFENDPEFKAQVKNDANEFGFRYISGPIDGMSNRLFISGMDALNFDGCNTVLGFDWSLAKIPFGAVRYTAYFPESRGLAPRIRDFLEIPDVPFEKRDLYDENTVGSIDAAMNATADRFIVESDNQLQLYRSYKYWTEKPAGNSWMVVLLFKRMTKGQIAAHKAWVTRRRNKQ